MQDDRLSSLYSLTHYLFNTLNFNGGYLAKGDKCETKVNSLEITQSYKVMTITYGDNINWPHVS